MARDGKAGVKSSPKKLELAVVLISLVVGAGILWKASGDWSQPPPTLAFVAFAIAIGVLTFEAYAQEGGIRQPRAWAWPKLAPRRRPGVETSRKERAYSAAEKKLMREIEELKKENARLRKRASSGSRRGPG